MFTNNLSNLPPGVSDRDIEGQQNCFCLYCGKEFESENEMDICAKCEAKADEGD